MSAIRNDPVTIDLDLQQATDFTPLPDKDQFLSWVSTALRGRAEAELTVRLVNREESRQLNSQYRNRDCPTNVLSFPVEIPEEVDLSLLGDVVICAPLVADEAIRQEKQPEHHWAHLTIHGVLHLLGYDHQEDHQAAVMEALEIELLNSLGIPNPYA